MVDGCRHRFNIHGVASKRTWVEGGPYDPSANYHISSAKDCISWAEGFPSAESWPSIYFKNNILKNVYCFDLMPPKLFHPILVFFIGDNLSSSCSHHFLWIFGGSYWGPSSGRFLLFFSLTVNEGPASEVFPESATGLAIDLGFVNKLDNSRLFGFMRDGGLGLGL